MPWTPVPPTTPRTGRLPGTFVGDLGGRVVVVSTRTGKVEDDRTVGTGQTNQGITTGNPTW
jgi:hypothetical protein